MTFKVSKAVHAEHSTCILIHKLADLYQHVYRPFESAILSHRPDSHASILTMYARLLNHWTVLLLADDEIPVDAAKNISALIRHGNALAQTLAQASPSFESDSTVLDFYEQTLRLLSDEKLIIHIKIEMAPIFLIYDLFFSHSLSTQSRLCRIMAFYKKGLEASMADRTRARGYDKNYVNTYNGLLMDICNCLWRSRAFSTAEANAKGCMVPQRAVVALTRYVALIDESFSLASLFGLSHSPSLCYQSIQQVRDLEDEAIARGTGILTRHAGPVTQESLTRLELTGGLSLTWQAYRVKTLQGLSSKGVTGVTDLLKSTMTVLRNALDGNASVSGSQLSNRS